MVEISFHGRGGQGAVVASQILAKAFFVMGLYPQCFALFGGERRGAPVASFLRVDSRQIFLKCEIKRPDHIIHMAPDLIDESEIARILKPGGLILINNSLSSSSYSSLRQFRLAFVDANGIAEEAGLGGAINTAVLGAYAKVNGTIPYHCLERAIEENVPAKIHENLAAARRAYEVTEVFQEAE